MLDLLKKVSTIVLFLMSKEITGFTQTETKKTFSSSNMASSERDDEWQSISSRQRQRKPQQWSAGPPLFVEPIPPTPATKSFEPFMILLIGLPGSGKSTFASIICDAMPYKFERVNQDQLKTRQKCVARAKKALSEGKCPIIDRCNFDKAQRHTWFKLAKASNVAVDGLVFQVPVTLCISRCQQRQNHETVKPEAAKKVIFTVKNQLKLPDRSELSNYHSLLTLSNSDAFSDAINQYLNKQA